MHSPLLTLGIALSLALTPPLAPMHAPRAAAAQPKGGPHGATPVVHDGAWAWPVDLPRQLIRPFLAPAERWSAGHRGIDLAAGAQLLAPAAGIVHYAGEVVDRGVLSIDHGDGVVSSYEPVTPLVAAGDPVRPGQPIARIDPGHCTVHCLHLGVRLEGEYVNPLRWLGGVPRAVLMPARPLD